MPHLDEHHILLFLVQIFIIFLLARGLGELFRRWKQPALTAELLVGILLGPTLLGRFFPEFHQILFPIDPIQWAMFDTLAWVGVLFLLLDTGLEIDFSIAWRQRGHALVIAFSDILIPMIVAFVPVLFLPDTYLVDPHRRILFALFMATVMTISAMPVAARSMHDLNLLKTDMGFLTLSALAVNDIVGWVLFTIILGLFTQTGAALGSVSLILVLIIGFAALALSVGRRFSTWAIGATRRIGLQEPAASLTLTCLIGILFGALTQKLGIHALFGFFIAGVMMGEAKNLSEDTRGIISQMVHAIFVPIFFAGIGLKIDFLAHFDLGLVGLITVIGIAGRYLGAWVGVGLTRVPRINRNLIAIAHTPGGMMEIVVALLAFNAGLITPSIFIAIVFSAVFSSVIMGPWMARALTRRRGASPIAYLAPESIIPDLAATHRADAILEMARRAAPHLKNWTPEQIAQPALYRENEFGTAIGHGIAIPHARLEGVPHPLLVFARCSDGIEWDAPDGLPVRHLFFLVTPANARDLHVQILSQMARAMQLPHAQSDIDAAATAADIHATLARLLKPKPA